MLRALFPALFCGTAVDAYELREFQGLATPVQFSAGKTIFSEGEQANIVFGLSQGFVRLYKLLIDGRRQVVAFKLPGDFLAMPRAELHKFSADAIGEVTLSQFSRNDLIELIESSPNLMRLLIDFVSRELDLAQDQLLLLGHGSAEEKVAMFLVGWRNRLARLSMFSEIVPLPMRRRDIADFLGLKLETVSRTFARLERNHAIRVVSKGVALTGLDQSLLVKERICEPHV